MKTNFEDLAKAAAARQSGEIVIDPDTEARKRKKKKLAIAMLVLNAIAAVFVGVGWFMNVLACTLIGAGVAIVSFVISRICKRI